jgi:hypothetical protein
MLIDYLTLNYMFAYFWIAIWLSYQLFIYACFDANFRENYFSANFSLIFIFSVWSVWTNVAYSSNASGPANCWSGSRPSGRVSNTYRRNPYRYRSIALSASYTPLHFVLFIMSCCVRFLTDFSRDFDILCTSLLISLYSLCFSLFF